MGKKAAAALARGRDRRLRRHQDEPPAPAGPTRDEMLEQLAGMGADVALFDSLDDAALAEMVRLLSMAEPATAGEGDDTLTGAADGSDDTLMGAADDDTLESVPAPMSSGRQPKAISLRFADVEKAVAVAVDRAVARVEKRIGERLARVDGRVAAADEDARKREVVEFCERMVAEGKLLPAEVEAGIVDDILAMDDSAPVQFSEGSMTRSAHFMQTLRKRPKLLNFAERVRGPANGGGIDVELAVVEKFAEDNEQSLAKVGTTKKDYVETFKKAKARDPNYRAKDFIGAA